LVCCGFFQAADTQEIAMVSPDSPKDAPKDAAKGGPPPPMGKKGKPDDEGGDDEKGATVLPGKQKFLPTGLSRAIVLAAVLGSIAVVAANLFANRFDLVPAPNSTNSFMYRIDRLTGGVQFCGPQGCTEVPRPAPAK